MKSNHTPGPWHVGMRPGPIIYGAQGASQVADLRNDLLPADERLANVRLITAAPELLEALEFMLRVGSSGIIGQQTAREMALAAIAKAKGQA